MPDTARSDRLRAFISSRKWRGTTVADDVRMLLAENDQLRSRVATWEMAALAGLLALGLDAETADRVGSRIRELSAKAAR